MKSHRLKQDRFRLAIKIISLRKKKENVFYCVMYWGLAAPWSCGGSPGRHQDMAGQPESFPLPQLRAGMGTQSTRVGPALGMGQSCPGNNNGAKLGWDSFVCPAWQGWGLETVPAH